MLGVGDIVTILKGGGTAVILVFVVALSLFITRKLRFPDEIESERERRISEVSYRDSIIQKQELHIDRQSDQIDRLQDNFDVALKTIKEDLIPLLEKTFSELRSAKTT